MGIYTGLSDLQLTAKIAELTTKYESLMGGGGIKRVMGEGRMLEYSQANSDGLKLLLDQALYEQAFRTGGDMGSAIAVGFP